MSAIKSMQKEEEMKHEMSGSKHHDDHTKGDRILPILDDEEDRPDRPISGSGENLKQKPEDEITGIPFTNLSYVY